MTRRRDQPDPAALTLPTRFLIHVAAQRGVTQSALAQRLPKASISTVSRWFRDEMTPNEDDYRALGEILGVPLNVFRALQTLEFMKGRPMLLTLAAWRHMIDCRSRYLLACGATMAAGAVHLREVPMGDTTLLLSLADPCAEHDAGESPLAATERQTEGVASGSMRSSWLTMFTIAAGLTRRTPSCRVRLWVRPTSWMPFGAAGGVPAGQLVANDWIAIEAGPSPDVSTFRVHFVGDPNWQRLVQPLLEQLAEADTMPGQMLVWDSRWERNDARRNLLRARLDTVLRGLQEADLMP